MPSLSDTEIGRARGTLRRAAVERLSREELVGEMKRLRAMRARYQGDLAARDFATESEQVLRNTIAYYDQLIAEGEREVRRWLRADAPPTPIGERPADLLARFERARYADIVDVAQTLLGVAAIKTGPGRYKIACPFHEDRRPSLMLYPPGKGWYCFVCQTGGPDAASFAAAVRNTTQLQGLLWVEQVTAVPGVA